MTMFGWFRKKKRTTPDEASAVLYSESKIGIDEECLSDIDQALVKRINAIMHFTKVAIIIQWLRILERSTKAESRWAAVLDSFERRVFPAGPAEGIDLVGYVNELIASTLQVQEIIKGIKENSLSEQDTYRRMRIWWEEWLDPISPDKDLVKQVGFLYGHTLALHVSREMKEVASLLTTIGELLQE